MIYIRFFCFKLAVAAAAKTATSPASLRVARRAPYQLWQCVLNVVLVEANNLPGTDANNLSDPYVKFRLDNERYRSKTIRHTVNPRFLEQFQLYIYDLSKAVLEIGIFDYIQTANYDDLLAK